MKISKKNSNAEKRFHGMKIVTSDELIRDAHVVEFNSNNELVCRYYNKDAASDDETVKLDFPCDMNPSEANIIKSIKEQIGRNSFLISEDVVDYIHRYIS